MRLLLTLLLFMYSLGELMAPPSIQQSPDLIGYITVFEPTEYTNGEFTVYVHSLQYGVTPYQVLGVIVDKFEEDICKYCISLYMKPDSSRMEELINQNSTNKY